MSRRLVRQGHDAEAAQPARALPGTTCSTLAGYQAQSQLGSTSGHSADVRKGRSTGE